MASSRNWNYGTRAASGFLLSRRKVNDAEDIATGTRMNADGHTARTLPCGRALTARNNVIVDVNTCRANPADSAVNIANQIAAKVQTAVRPSLHLQVARAS